MRKRLIDMTDEERKLAETQAIDNIIEARREQLHFIKMEEKNIKKFKVLRRKYILRDIKQERDSKKRFDDIIALDVNETKIKKGKC